MGVRLMVTHPGPGGTCTIPLSVEDVEAFRADGAAVIARHYGVTRAQYLAWCEEQFSVQCVANTKVGKRCRNVVLGGTSVMPGEWVRLHGGYCASHG